MASSDSDLNYGIQENIYNLRSDELQEDDNNCEEIKVLSILWKGGKLGAAYFNCLTKSLYVYEENSETSPQFYLSSSIYRQVAPKYLITLGKMSEDYIKHLIDIVSSINGTTTTDTVRTLPPNMFLLAFKDYSFETCRTILSELNLNHSDDPCLDSELYVNSLINFDYKTSVHAAGALVKYLDKNWAHFLSTKEDLQYFHIAQISLKGHVLMDLTTLNALQVFQQCSHDASFKRGMQGSNREGLSVFKLFSSSCKSKIGYTALRNILLKPRNDMQELINRLDFIGFVLHPSHQDFIESLQDNIKSLVDINLVLIKIKNSRASCRDWKVIYKSIYHTIYIRELTAPYQSSCGILNEFYNSITKELTTLENSINNAIDFSDTNRTYGRPVIKLGLDESLDAKKLRCQDIRQHVTAAAGVAAQELPDYLQECEIVYLPEMGHLISIKKWEPNCDPESLQEFGFQFMFTLRGTIHYKNPLCLELDASLGDINAEIIAHENRILQRLTSFILKYNKDIREPLRYLAYIDALIAIAKVSAQNNYIRPYLNMENIHEIQECRHPLLELVSNFEANDFFSGQHHSHIKIITGPNGSGKSVYLKGVALVIYLAHIGSYVPAKTANIGMMHSIHSRMQITESASVRLSAFMIDAIQATQAIHNACHNSLIFFDELGRGTTIDEGFGLLAGMLRCFSKRGDSCPHILVSTHHQSISQYLPDQSLIDYFKMTHSEENGAFLFLFKLTRGISNSFATSIAAQVGLGEKIIQRAKDLLENDRTISCVDPKESDYALISNHDLNSFLKDINIPEPDLE